MIVEFMLTTEEDDEAMVMEKVLQISKQFKQLSFKIDNTVIQAGNTFSDISELGEMESVRLQMAMDRLTKLMTTLSNLTKKISDTASAITQNLK